MSAELIYDLDEAIYHADDSALSASAAKVLLGKRPPSGDSDALRFGTLVHTVVLEPDRLDGYVVLDAHAIAGDNPKTGKPYDAPEMTAKFKAARKAAEDDGLAVVSQADWDRAHHMADAVRNHRTASALLAQATATEVSGYADHPTGARVRGRFDLIGPGFIADLKTCRDADPAGFGRTVHGLMYHLSAANYLDIGNACGLDADVFPLICVEKEPTPGGEHRVSVIELAPAAIDVGRDLMAQACQRWLDLGRRIDLPGYGDGWHTVDLPRWAYADQPTHDQEHAA